MTFDDFDLTEGLRHALAQLQFKTPTPIQQKSIPVILKGQDTIGCAATGSGKTLAFALPMIQRLEMNSGICLVLCPTRELAIQIESVFRKLLSTNSKLRLALVIGGANMHRQKKDLACHPHIIIATPGRLNDHLNQRTVNLSQVRAVVLDEADRMLDMGFAPQIERILNVTPKTRQTILFSATFPSSTQKLIQKMMRNPEKIVIGQAQIPVESIAQATIETTVQNKNEVLLDELNARQGAILIFTRTKNRTDRLFGYLADYGYSVSRIHGGRTQGQRNAAIKGFRENRFRIMVATDVAARGIDISDVAHVINYDLPQTPEDYVHRIGRTGRAGAKGEALSLLTPEDRGQWRQIQKVTSARLAQPKFVPSNQKNETAPNRVQKSFAPQKRHRPRFKAEGRRGAPSSHSRQH